MSAARRALPGLGFAALLLAVPQPASAIEGAGVILQGLDKTTARTSTFQVDIGETATFGSLRITPRHCDYTPPEEAPESAAFLEIVDERPDEEPVEAFSGWMFASSPALSALEHPVYDVWVLYCSDEPRAPDDEAEDDEDAENAAEE